MKEAKNYHEMLGAFRDNLCDIKSEKDLVWVQRLPWLLRLKFFACTFLIFNYLRLHKQLGREDHFFNRNVRKNVFKLFSVLMENKRN